jgi:F-type H+-transporting ATPase subunit b
MKKLALVALLLAIPMWAQKAPAAPAAGHDAPAATQTPATAQTPAAAQESPAAQHAEAKHEGGTEHRESPYTELWKWANFLILAGVLGYFIGKNAGPFFASRTKEIRKAMVEADALRKDAEAKAAAVDQRLANLQTEIEALRQEARDQESAEEQNMKQSTAAEIAKIQHHAEAEVAAAGKAARLNLKRYSAALAMELAERKIRERIGPEAQGGLVQDFIEDLQQPAKARHN